MGVLFLAGLLYFGSGAKSSAVVSGTGISGRVWSLGIDGGLYTREEEIYPELQLRRLSFPFLCLIFSRLDKNTAEYKTDTQYAQYYLLLDLRKRLSD